MRARGRRVARSVVVMERRAKLVGALFCFPCKNCRSFSRAIDRARSSSSTCRACVVRVSDWIHLHRAARRRHRANERTNPPAVARYRPPHLARARSYFARFNPHFYASTLIARIFPLCAPPFAFFTICVYFSTGLAATLRSVKRFDRDTRRRAVFFFPFISSTTIPDLI